MKQLQTDKAVLEAKLKEALATQPATVDPRELAKAQEKVQALAKENELLKAGLEQEKNRPVPAATSAKELEEAKRQLAATNARLAEQQELNQKLAAEKTSLAEQLGKTASAPELAEARRSLAETNARLVEQQALVAKLGAEKTSLQEQLGKAATSVEVAAALRAENELLKKQLSEAKALATTAADDKSSESGRKLAEAEARLAAMASSAEVLRLEKVALETKLKQMPVPAVAAAGAPAKSAPVARAGSEAQIKELERQRDALYKLLEKRGREAQDANSRELVAKVDQLTSEVNSLKSRLEVFETKAIPYTAEELALFRQSQPKPALAPVMAAPKVETKTEAKTETKPVEPRKSVKDLPAGTVALVAQAEKYFAAKQYDKAEENYLAILRQDDKNAYTLANLGAIQLELGRLAEAETNILRALAFAPDDPHANSLLGYLKFRQEKYDEAVVALNRAAKLNPQNADIQNYLGVTLSQKGLRGPAEQAFRKAIVLDPNHGGAQNNLAVFYATETPPNVALARFHYQKALASGHPRNAEIEALFDKRESAPKSTTP
ncbi:MAG: tetratricopeptide repeat protein [Verrucomicrobiota bacterium]